ncbi:hypothetical protein GH714_011682 [Hevea brasiliensis]|uniref:EngB-type G domain-containing protein n=1 Tax=Hevea brasiliensis TaxID=3981 RepID=A0A6A6LBA6_HEVBR|nr:hypothetical protein GH714_011682 [Hevea brasiliensis]
MKNATLEKKHPSFDVVDATESAQVSSGKRSTRARKEGKVGVDKYDLPKKQSKSKLDSRRSNVGKSSLLNALTRQWGVVRTSDKPGLTQTINFFKLGSKVSLVDLPGYGFAYAKEEVKDAWEELISDQYQIVLTKTDVIFPIDVARRATQIEESLKANKSIVQPVV